MARYRNASNTSWAVQVLNGHHRPETHEVWRSTHEHCHHHLNRTRLCSLIGLLLVLIHWRKHRLDQRWHILPMYVQSSAAYVAPYK